MEPRLKLSDFFSGICGFSHAGEEYGFETTTFCEIDPFRQRVIARHYPNVVIKNDVCLVNGAEIEPSDVFTFGSPCTRLSVAGRHDGFDVELVCELNPEHKTTKRATDKYVYRYESKCPVCGGKMSGTNESALFFHAIRVIEEMRGATNGRYPRFAVWENVPGAFSSNKGQDFRAVLEAFLETEIPMPRSGKWAAAGMVRGNGRSLAWRVLDAQYWGVPQRRRRIFLICDFGGQCAPEILFEREGVSGDFTESREAREETAASAGDGIAYGFQGKASATAGSIGWSKNIAPTIDTSGKAACLTVGTGRRYDPETETLIPIVHRQVAGTIRANAGMPKHEADWEQLIVHPTVTGTLCASGAGMSRPAGMASEMDLLVAAVDARNLSETQELSGTLQAKNTGGYSLNYQNPVRIGYAVRRLLPVECLRLQGFPDDWLDIDGASDTAKYRATGDSVAIPCVKFVMRRISEVLRRDTMTDYQTFLESKKFVMNHIYQGDALEALKLFPDNCIQTCVTSPPYWGLRDYGIDGQIGLEKSPEEYVAKMVRETTVAVGV